MPARWDQHRKSPLSRNSRTFFEEEVLQAKLESKVRNDRYLVPILPEEVRRDENNVGVGTLTKITQRMRNPVLIPAKCHWYSAMWYI